MKKEFKMVAGWVMSVLGIQNFAKDDDGKLFLTDDQKGKLTEKFGEKFVEGFMKDLGNMTVEGEEVNLTLSAEEKLELEAGRIELAQLKKRVDTLQEERKTFQATIEKLEKEPAKAEGNKVQLGKVKKHAADLSIGYNKWLADYVDGKVQAGYSWDDTVDTSDLKTEFGKYVNSEKLEILRSLTAPTESTKYMTTIITDKTEVRATHAIIETVLQQFVPQWTPSGKSTFTPLTIKNFKLKINVPIQPSDIMEDVIGYLYDEQASTLQSMPIVRYILYQLIFPKLNEEREMALALGRFVESEADGNGEYSATDAMESMDGYLTQLVDLYNDADTDITWLQSGVSITSDNILSVIDAAVDQVSPLYKRKNLTVHADPDLITMYQRAYREKYKVTKNEDGEVTRIDFTKFTFAPLEGMRGSKCFFITPKENFKHLLSKDPNATKLRFQEQDYVVKIFGEFWEGTGFWLKEAIFAYISPEAAVRYNGLINPSLSFPKKEYNAQVGVSFTAPTLTKTPNTISVTYTSSDTDVATVNSSTGAISLVAAGTTIITAAFAGSETINPANTSYKLVVAAAGGGGV